MLWNTTNVDVMQGNIPLLHIAPRSPSFSNAGRRSDVGASLPLALPVRLLARRPNLPSLH